MSEVWVAQRQEAAHVSRLLLAFRDWFESEQPSAESMAASVKLLIADAATEYLLGSVEEGAQPSGVCQLRFRHSVWTGTPDCWLEDLYVEEHARGRGLGAALVMLACERASARGAQRIELDTNEDNAGAIALYQSLGFSSASKVHGPLTGRDVFMGRRLP
ncbi:MAG TPA: GNAT family N-acetyltransferase [Solirubrobacteraceae bacterium]|nr:GNAT family N-acetyltransferase [Solirubrobacteraceae bacterium]